MVQTFTLAYTDSLVLGKLVDSHQGVDSFANIWLIQPSCVCSLAGSRRCYGSVVYAACIGVKSLFYTLARCIHMVQTTVAARVWNMVHTGGLAISYALVLSLRVVRIPLSIPSGFMAQMMWFRL